MAGEEFLVGANPLLAIASGFEFVLSQGGLEGPRATGDPNEIIPYSVQAPVELADQMLVLGEAGLMAQTGPAPGEPFGPFVFDKPAPGTPAPPSPGLPVPQTPVQTSPVPYQQPGLPAGNRPFEPLPPPTEPLTLPPPFPWQNIFRIGTGIGGLLWPSEIGEEWPAGTAPTRGTERLPPTPTQEQLDRIADPYGISPEENARIMREAQAEADRYAQQTAAQWPMPATPAAPAKAATPTSSTRNRLWQWIAVGLGVGGLSSRSSRSSSTVDPLSSGALTSLEEALRTSLVGSSSQVQVAPGGAGAWGTTSSSQYCQPKPRGPRRKCLQRAPVRFSGGPRKGKSAGTKCIRYAAARSSR